MGCGASSQGGPSYRTNNEGGAAGEPVRRVSITSPEVQPSTGPRKKKTSDMPLFRGVKPHQIGTYSAHGIKPGNNGTAYAKINQDRGLVTYPFNDDPRMAFFGVFDGHGSNGEQVSEFVMWAVQAQLLAAPVLNESTATQALITAFEEADRLLSESSVPAKVSGTAAVVALVIGSTIFVANSGDSRAVIAHQDAKSASTVVTGLTVDQKPDKPEEVHAHAHAHAAHHHPRRQSRSPLSPPPLPRAHAHNSKPSAVL